MAWRRSSYCADGTCLEVADVGNAVLVRDSKNLVLPSLRFHPAAWAQFLDDVKQGTFDRS